MEVMGKEWDQGGWLGPCCSGPGGSHDRGLGLGTSCRIEGPLWGHVVNIELI